MRSERRSSRQRRDGIRFEPSTSQTSSTPSVCLRVIAQSLFTHRFPDQPSPSAYRPCGSTLSFLGAPSHFSELSSQPSGLRFLHTFVTFLTIFRCSLGQLSGSPYWGYWSNHIKFRVCLSLPSDYECGQTVII